MKTPWYCKVVVLQEKMASADVPPAFRSHRYE
jgi:hypothetical protein